MRTWPKKLEILLLLVLILFSTWGIADIHRKITNTLQNNGQWIVSKTLLEKNVMGAENFLYNTQALSGGKVNFGAWHGFQEIIYSQKIQPKKIEFDFFLTENSYLFFIFNKQKETFSAIRLSAHPDYKNQYVTAFSSGEFRSEHDIDINKMQTNTWHHFSLDFTQTGSATLTIDNTSTPLNIAIFPDEYLGFRGSLKESFIDNFSIKTNKGLVYKDNFEKPFQGKIILITIAIFLFTFFIFYFLIPKVFHFSKEKTFLLSLSLFLTSFIFVIASHIYVTSSYLSQYPDFKSFWSRIKKQEKVYVESEAERIHKIIMNRYGLKEKETDVTRVLFLGTSQTWGAGADTEEHTFVALAEKEMNKNSTKKYEFINTGISGVTSDELTKLYEKDWINLQPSVVFINLATNDGGNEVSLRINLQKIINLNKEKNITTFLFLEPNTTEDFREPNHIYKAMIQIAEKNGIRYFDLNQYLKEKNQSGILWWDFVHPTSYGHQLISEIVLKALRELPQ